MYRRIAIPSDFQFALTRKPNNYYFIESKGFNNKAASTLTKFDIGY